MDQHRIPLTVVGIVLLVGLAVAGLTWLNIRYCAQNPGGYEFLNRWQGTRLFMVNGQSPYSDATTLENQRQMYGRRARPGQDPGYFLYPFYSFLLFAPFAVIKDPVLARAVWMTFLELCLLGLVAASLSLARWRISLPMLVLLAVFIATWFHTLHPLESGNAAIFSALMIATALLAIRSENDVLAGFLLVLASVKPQMVFLLAIFVLIWAVSHQRWLLFWSFTGILGLLVAATSLLIPNWLWQNAQQVLVYATSTPVGTPGALFIRWFPGVGRQIGWVFTVFIAGMLFWEWRAGLGKDFRWFLWIAYLTLALTNLVGIRTSIDNFIFLLPALVLILGVWNERWGMAGWIMTLLTLLLLSPALWALVVNGAQKGLPVDLNPRIFFFLPLVMLTGLYWVRYWAVRPVRLPYEELARVG